MDVEGPGLRFQSASPFASPPLDSSVHGSSASHRFHSKNPFASESPQDTYSLDLFTHSRKLNKPIKNPADYLSVALLLMVGTKKAPLYFLLQAFEEKPKRCLMVCLIVIVEITPRLLTNQSFGLVLESSVNYTKRVE